MTVYRHPDGSEIRIDESLTPQPIVAVGDGTNAELRTLANGIVALWHGPLNPPPEGERALEALGAEPDALTYRMHISVKLP